MIYLGQNFSREIRNGQMNLLKQGCQQTQHLYGCFHTIFVQFLGFEDPTNLNLVVSTILGFKRAIFSRDAVRFLNPGGQALMCWA